MDDLPSQFDVVVVGTGLAESIVSAAVSRNGHTVLHLDPRDYYGGKWTTVNWETVHSGAFAKNPDGGDESNVDYGDLVWNNPIRDVEQRWYTSNEDTKTELSKSSRKFNIDILPKVILARDDMIQLLIQSNVSRYLEFKCITKLMANLLPPQENVLQSIPLSRSDIFTTKSLGLVEKRKLTKFIESILVPTKEPTVETTESPETSPQKSPKTFEELVKSAGINEKIQHLMKSAVSTVEDGFGDSEDLNEEFVERCQLFLQSIGRYGNQTPYLWTLYGVGEICQAFCRLSAIYGGIFILKRSIQEVRCIEESEDEIMIKSNESEIKTKYLVLGSEVNYYKDSSAICKTRTLIRGILLTTGSLAQEPNERGDSATGNQMLVYKIGDSEVIELDHTSLAVPKPYRLVHMTCPLRPCYQQMSPRKIIESTLEPFLDFTDENLVGQDVSIAKPMVLHGSYFLIDFHEKESLIAQEEGEVATTESTISNKIFYCANLSTEITTEIKRAREIFSKMYPLEEFLPQASDGGSDDADNANELADEPDNEETNNEGTVSNDSNNENKKIDPTVDSVD